MSNQISVRSELKSTFTAYWEALAIRAAIQLDIFEALSGQAYRAEKLLHLLQIPFSKGILLLDAMRILGMLAEESGKLRLTEKGQLLTATHPQSLREPALLWGGEHLNAWQALAQGIRAGQPAFELIYGTAFFDYIGQRPELLQNYHRAMAAYAQEDYANLARQIPLAQHKAVLDLGGGLGALLRQIHPDLPGVQLYLLDLPEVIALVGPDPPFQLIAGDFQKSIPKIADGIILARVLHDWPDEIALELLKRCWEALPAGGQVYILENLIDQIADRAALLSLNMAAICDSFEREGQAFQHLLEAAGFSLQKIIAINPLQSALIASK